MVLTKKSFTIDVHTMGKVACSLEGSIPSNTRIQTHLLHLCAGALALIPCVS